MEESILEEWRDVVGYEGLYEVSNLGRVRSYYGREIKYLKGRKTKIGYIQVELYKNGKGKFCSIHRLVWEGFHVPIPIGYEIDHVNTIRDDNRLVNLRCVTSKENKRNSITAERMKEARRRRNTEWLKNVRCAVRRARAKAVLQLDKKTGYVIREWECMSDAARELKLSHGNISLCCYGKKKSIGGYRWKFA